MKLFSGFKKIFEKRARLVQGADSWIVGPNTASGEVVTYDTAMQVSSVYSAIKVLSESIASLPLILYKRDGANKVKDFDHPLYDKLHSQPNRLQDATTFFEFLVTNICLRGNFYCQKIYAKNGSLLELWPLVTDSVTVKVSDSGEKSFYYNTKKPKTFSADQIVHFMGLSTDGIVGVSPIDLARETVGTSLATEQYGARFFSNGTTAPNIIKLPGRLSKEGADRLRDSFHKTYAGAANAHKAIILEEGAEIQRVEMSNEQSQFLQTRKFQVTEIARWFRVPPHMIGDLDRATFSNIEQQSLEFVTFTLMPWLIRIERALMTALFTAEERKRYKVEFLVDGLLRGDGLSRAQKLQIERQNGVINADEWREIENRNPLPDGKGQEYITPLNMKEVGAEPQEEQPQSEPVAKEEGKDKARMIEILAPLIRVSVKKSLEKTVKNGLKKENLQELRAAIEPVIEAANVAKDALDHVESAVKVLYQGEHTPDQARENVEQAQKIAVDVLRAFVGTHIPEIVVRKEIIQPVLNVQTAPAQVSVDVKMPEQRATKKSAVMELGKDGKRKWIIKDEAEK